MKNKEEAYNENREETEFFHFLLSPDKVLPYNIKLLFWCKLQKGIREKEMKEKGTISEKNKKNKKSNVS